MFPTSSKRLFFFCYNAFLMDRVRILLNLKFFSHPLLLLLYMYFYWFMFRDCFYLDCEAEGRHMYCFSGVVGGVGVNFCQVFAFF